MNTLLQIPVPKDIPLDLPLPKTILIIVLILSFLLHILFVNLMVGGTLLTLWYQIKGLKNKDYDTLAREIASTITVNKSLAVVLGVAPLLGINTLYTVYFYSANALTGAFWISIVPLVTITFLLIYAHKYSWDKLSNNKPLHISIIGFASFILLFIPLIFLSNINLMLFPEKWADIKGFFSALTLPNVFPRYLHFLTASLAITSLFLFAYFGRKRYSAEGKYKSLSIPQVRKKIYNVAFVATVTQLVFGPVLLLTLPSKGINWTMMFIILGGVTLSIFALVWMWKSINGTDELINKNFIKVATVITCTVIFMGTGRHFYRANSLKEHQQLITRRTELHKQMVEQAKINLLNPDSEAQETLSPGEVLFNKNCAVCHKYDSRLVGPPVTEMIEIYSNDPKAMKDWIIEPGRKRMDYPQMTGFPNLTEAELTNLTDYLLNLDI